GLEAGALAHRQTGAVALAVGARPERKGVPNRACRRAVAARAALGIELRDHHALRARRAICELQLAQAELLAGGVELHGLDRMVAALCGVAVEGDDKARVGAEENDARILQGRALQA